MALTDQAQALITAHFNSDKFVDAGLKPRLAIDATCGNGYDTEFLAGLNFAKVIGFDIQQAAIDMTRRRIAKAGYVNVTLYQQGHENLQQYVSQQVDCVLFNLGYLPNADKRITTTRDTSLLALESALGLLSPHGLISVICYPGHAEGLLETGAIQNRLATLDHSWQVDTVLSDLPSNSTPVLYLLRRSGG